MAHNAELEAAILASPNDAARYAVYADWLQAHGDPRGELISVQVALASTTDPKRFLELKGREQRLIDSVAPAAVPLEGALASWVELSWRFGFVHQLTFDPLRPPAAPADAADPTRELAGLFARPALKLLRTARLRAVGVDAGPMLEVLVSAKLPLLDRLETRGAVQNLPRIADAYPNLQHLILWRPQPLDGAVLGRFPALRTLELHMQTAPGSACAVVREAPWKKLKRLVLHADGFGVSDLQGVLALRELKDLVLTTHTEGAVDALARSPCLPRLTALELRERCDDETVRPLLERRDALKNLKLVIMRGELSLDLVRRLRKAVKLLVLENVFVDAEEEAGVHIMDPEEAANWRELEQRRARAGEYNHDEWN